MSTIQTYGGFRPTQFDRAGLFLPDRQAWLVAPVSQTRDSGALDQSNFAMCLQALGGESETVEVHRFGHWGPGWYEIILIDPADDARVSEAESIACALADYPVLDDEDYSAREYADYVRNWLWAERDFVHQLPITNIARDVISDAPDVARALFESLIPSGEYFTSCSDGPSIHTDTALRNLQRNPGARSILARAIHQARAITRSNTK